MPFSAAAAEAGSPGYISRKRWPWKSLLSCPSKVGLLREERSSIGSAAIDHTHTYPVEPVIPRSSAASTRGMIDCASAYARRILQPESCTARKAVAALSSYPPHEADTTSTPAEERLLCTSSISLFATELCDTTLTRLHPISTTMSATARLTTALSGTVRTNAGLPVTSVDPYAGESNTASSACETRVGATGSAPVPRSRSLEPAATQSMTACTSATAGSFLETSMTTSSTLRRSPPPTSRSASHPGTNEQSADLMCSRARSAAAVSIMLPRSLVSATPMHISVSGTELALGVATQEMAVESEVTVPTNWQMEREALHSRIVLHMGELEHPWLQMQPRSSSSAKRCPKDVQHLVTI
mmetsp:Transcript_16781/g.53081  ORF Transcript_16781/g.53081 Transcript_16781/m.53081 type:complete len:356 (-) Transcript_16781:796-1863(-)